MGKTLTEMSDIAVEGLAEDFTVGRGHLVHESLGNLHIGQLDAVFIDLCHFGTPFISAIGRHPI